MPPPRGLLVGGVLAHSHAASTPGRRAHMSSGRGGYCGCAGRWRCILGGWDGRFWCARAMTSAKGRPSARSHAGERDARAPCSVAPQNPKKMLGVGRFRILNARLTTANIKLPFPPPSTATAPRKSPAHPIFQIPSGNGRLINGPPRCVIRLWAQLSRAPRRIYDQLH